MEMENNNNFPVLEVLVTKGGLNLYTKVYQKIIHTQRCLHFKSDHPKYVSERSVHSLVTWTKSFAKNRKILKK
jgi:hypothetical protein